MPPIISGGVIYIEKISAELAKLSWEVTVLTQNIGNQYSRVQDTNGYRVIRFWSGRMSRGNASALDHFRFMFFCLPQMLFFLRNKEISIQLCLFSIPGGLIGFLIKKILKIPYVTIVDGADMPGIASDMGRIVKVIRPAIISVINSSDAVVLLDGLDDIALPIINNANIRHIGTGIKLPNNHATPGTHADGVLRLLSIGRLTKRKGFHHIIEACALLRNEGFHKFHLKIVGYGKEAVMLHNLIATHGLEENIDLVGRVEYDDIENYYLEADCYIFFGDREGQSLAMMEAAAYGLPIICSDHPGNNYLVKNLINGISVEHPNIRKLFEAIRYYILHRDQLRKMGEMGKDFSYNFGWDKIALSYDSLLSECQKNHK
jgi:glycosyltransferase involved in cell wall biosynthesis